ncbi:MAG: AarF/ABC1/UbiB kinase family protein [Armatimonadetes bacterium]|nr:AarF/ABC1/UbiB kinase family protein [Armatimonadota bacterium]
MQFEAISRHTKRYRQVGIVATHHQLGYLLDQAGLARLLPRKWRRGGNAEAEFPGRNTWRRVRLALEELGGTFIKLGQILSTRRDLLPDDLVDELEKLQDEVPSLPYSEVRQVIEAEMGADPEELFATFEHNPVAAASIAQVHFATLRTGDQVAVKVQRPHIADAMETDFEILLNLARLLERSTSWARQQGVVDIVRQIMEATREEMDFTLEGHNADRFRNNFADEPGVHIPKIYWEYTTKRVLTMERITGAKLNDLITIDSKPIDRKEIARLGAKLYLKQVLEDGFFHADPHAGNIFIEDNGRIALVDFGAVGRIDEDLREQIADLFLAIVRRDIKAIIDALLTIGIAPNDVDRTAMARDISRTVSKYYGLPIQQLRAAEIVSKQMALARKYSIRIPADFTLATKTVVILDGIGRSIDPTFNIFEVAQPFAREMIRRRFSPARLFVDMLNDVQGAHRLLRSAPQDIASLLDSLQSGRLTVKFEPSRIDRPVSDLHQMINRLSFSIVVAAIIVGSSLIVQTGVGPLFHGWSVLGILGYVTASLLGFYLLVSMLRHGRL